MHLIYKKLGETPLEALNRFRLKNNIENKLAYAGRLDPMAKGLLVVLEGDECKKRDFYQNLDKVYKFQILFGIETDTFDSLGIITKINKSKINLNDLKKLVSELNGVELMQQYPPYSSKTVNGKPLFWWARNNKLNEIQIPQKKVKIYSLNIIKLSKMSSKEVLIENQKRLSLVRGDFRQLQIKNNWEEKLQFLNCQFIVCKLEAKVSSGTYIRSICNLIGPKLNSCAIAWEIERIQVGSFRLPRAMNR
ncbi:MAG: hypothetical protein KatS3mg086_130 [Candidatus Dojkabacteria bacterium]|nr:MAG: hypothetical protein KatS3mg086_130 [Candidatus Dojkabacteria bacterium]